MPNWVKGLDVSFSQTSYQWWKDRADEGYRVAGQCLWTGGYQNNAQLREVAELNLRCAREAGLLTIGYTNASPWFNTGVSLSETLRNAGEEWQYLKAVAVDVEIDGLTLASIANMIAAVDDAVPAGVLVPIYSARWFWAGHLGDPHDFADRLIWNAYYDSDLDVDFPSWPYGGFSRVFGEQYQGTTEIDGVSVDLNVFDLDLLEVGNMTDQDIADIKGSLTRIERILMGQDPLSGDQVYDLYGIALNETKGLARLALALNVDNWGLGEVLLGGLDLGRRAKLRDALARLDELVGNP